ncbi:MAG: DUF6554 family protein [Prochlorococcus sp.]|jgi:hypothetical protein|nr:DUF6554 family protein [Prochlorococcaceae cyanobacterium Fu_MAG_50]
MAWSRFPIAISISLLSLAGISSAAFADGNSKTASRGAQVYCYMRSNGNDHKVSWNASYALIKRQGQGMFKTSPQHAAVMITEAVVEEPGSYPDCGRFLGDLFGGSETLQSSTITSSYPSTSDQSSTVNPEASTNSYSSSPNSDQRYSY